MYNHSLFATFAIAGLAAAGCRDRTIEHSPGEVLARDSSLSSEIRQADTSTSAADAMAFDPDSALPPVNANGRSTPMRPVPATIHPDPIPAHRLPAAPPRPRPAARVDPVAAEILRSVPGAPIP